MKWNLTEERRRALVYLPLVILPFCCLVFHVLGGGRGVAARAVPKGLDMQLPAVAVDLQKAFQDKLKTYEEADKDSARLAQYRRMDTTRGVGAAAFVDRRALQIQQRLTRLRQTVERPAAGYPVLAATPAYREEASRGLAMPRPYGEELASGAGPAYREAATYRRETAYREAAKAAPDPQLDRLNAMLDKVIRIQHPQEAVGSAPVATATAGHPEEVLPADSLANSIGAMVPEDQVLVAGGTIALRTTDSIRVGGWVRPPGEMVYGTVTINNDRLLVHIGSLREERNLYTTDWQVVDLDGLPGIHIPGVLGREVVKQSADQGVSSLNVLTMDPSLGAQAAGAGIQAAKSFLGRKVRQVRVTVRAGYQVLLRSPRMAEGRRNKPTGDVVAGVGLTNGFAAGSKDGPAGTGDAAPAPPEWTPERCVLAQCRNEGVEVRLRQVCIRDGCLWLGLEWRNRSPIEYRPGWLRWTIRDRQAFRRTAMQEQGLEPLVESQLPVVGADSIEHSLAGFRPFALARDKELVLAVGEKSGGRNLVLTISPGVILKARNDAKASQ